MRSRHAPWILAALLARRIEPVEGYRFVWIGGDELAGLAGVPAPGTTPC